jgi:hypothetical protein
MHPYAKWNCTFSLLSLLTESELHKNIDRELLGCNPPIYHTFVRPSPVYMSDDMLSLSSLRDLPYPSNPLIFISFEINILSLAAMGKENIPCSLAL